MPDHVKLSSIPSSIPFSFFSRKFSLAFSFSLKHVVIPLRIGSDLIHRARLALRFVEKYARNATLLLVGEGSLPEIESSARRLGLLLAGLRRRELALVPVRVRTVSEQRIPEAVRSLGAVDLMLLPGRQGAMAEAAGQSRCPVLVLDP